MRVIGTAGHVDHGKSTLVSALTGTHPDRLKEEREREMTIDLGFAFMQMSDGETIGIVDVPGHRDFIENMLAGVGGIDAVLFVIAADEGVMPQTREHLSILDLLQIHSGIIALTKIDMVDDPEWMDLIEMDIRQIVQGTVLEEAPIVRVSAKTKAGLPELRQKLEEILEKIPLRLDLSKPRLPIDRIFTISGFGTVVTGTLADGHFQIGNEVEILPGDLHGRIRGLQTHNLKVEKALPGSRTAINISGVDVSEIQRGSIVALPGQYRISNLLDVHFRFLPDASNILKHFSEVKMFLNTAEVLANVRLLGCDELIPGEEGWLQLELHEPVVASRGDHYILRRPSPGETIGGGIVVDPHPKARHKRHAQGTIDSLQALLTGSPEEVLFQSSSALGPAPLKDVVQRARLPREQAEKALQELTKQRKLILLEEGNSSLDSDILIVAGPQWENLASRGLQIVAAYHQRFPLRRGIPREEVKSRLKLPPHVSAAMIQKLVDDGQLVENGPILAHHGFQIEYTPPQELKIKQCLKKFSASPYSPPGVKETQDELGEELYASLVDLGRLKPVSPDVVFRAEDYERMTQEVRKHIEKFGSLTLAQFRDSFNTTRKYAQAFLEHLDQIGVTVRYGDARKLK
jgi:selenocysteine-specific elongation factor